MKDLGERQSAKAYGAESKPTDFEKMAALATIAVAIKGAPEDIEHRVLQIGVGGIASWQAWCQPGAFGPSYCSIEG